MDLYALTVHRLRGDLIESNKILNGYTYIDNTIFFQLKRDDTEPTISHNRTRGQQWKIYKAQTKN